MARYINADELIQFCTEKLIATEDDAIIQTHNNAFKCMRVYIKSLPSADVVEVKHGEWIRLPDGWDGVDEYERYKCSVCNQPNSWGDTPFCKWCGADMRERRESE